MAYDTRSPGGSPKASPGSTATLASRSSKLAQLASAIDFPPLATFSKLLFCIEEEVKRSLWGRTLYFGHAIHDAHRDAEAPVKHCVHVSYEDAVIAPKNACCSMPRYSARIGRGVSLEILHCANDMLRPAGIPDPPTRHRMTLGKRVHKNGLLFYALLQLHNIAMRRSSSHQIGIALVEDDPELPFCCHSCHAKKRFAVIDHARRVVGAVVVEAVVVEAVNDDCLGCRSDGPHQIVYG
jgi:hypothetical protein